MDFDERSRHRIVQQLIPSPPIFPSVAAAARDTGRRRDAAFYHRHCRDFISPTDTQLFFRERGLTMRWSERRPALRSRAA
jgi:hypothetical protein